MNIKLRVLVWTLLATIAVSSVLLVSRSYGDEYRDLSREYNRVYADFLREKIVKIPKGAPVRLDLKDGRVLFGRFEGFQKYDDGVWIRPVDARFGFLSDDAYDVRELQDINIVVFTNV